MSGLSFPVLNVKKDDRAEKLRRFVCFHKMLRKCFSKFWAKNWSAIENLFAQSWSSMSGLSFAVLRVKKYGRSERWWREQVSLIYRLWLRRLWWFHFSPRPHNSLAALVSCVVHEKGGGFSAFVSWKISWEDGRGEKLWRFVCFALGLDNIFFKNLRGNRSAIQNLIASS